MALLTISNLSRSFQGIRAVCELSLEVGQAEFFGLLGPSGCGKTTVLRMIAGLEVPDQGTIEFDGSDITALKPERRGFGFVFQNYALFPHLTVFENVAFGLRSRKLASADIAERVDEALSLVQLSGFEHRQIGQMSGGQQQRVAIARAISIRPRLLLLDEPLSNLDNALREETRFELRELIKRLGLTAIYVTHDQDDAFALCDRIAVMTSGRILQVGTPQQIYEQPTAVAVARFLGKNNLIPVMRISSMKSDSGMFKTVDGGHILHLNVSRSSLAPLDRQCVLAIRPENVRITPDACITPATENCIAGEVVDVRFSGGTFGMHITAGGLAIEASTLEQGPFRLGSRCSVYLPPEHLRLLNE